jgi:pseudouridine-5'-phosphate glycosidase
MTHQAAGVIKGEDIMVVSGAVAAAVKRGDPVVALESTVITHGLPFPANRETALAMESAVRGAGALPATIALIDGRIRVGLSADEIDRLAALPRHSVRKCSRRDFPIIVARRENGATTVAGTMIVAHWAGIRVLATGGIGGVHRGQPFDISADLTELGRTPVAVVCSGPKSILDLPLTLEVLETNGVPVVGYQTGTLPAFYSRDSGLAVDVRVEGPDEAAAIVHAAGRLGMEQGILVAVPVPEADQVPFGEAEAAIAAATNEAAAQGIHGKALTPYLLGRISELSKGTSQRANVSLLVNNARVGGLVASALAQLAGG